MLLTIVRLEKHRVPGIGAIDVCDQGCYLGSFTNACPAAPAEKAPGAKNAHVEERAYIRVHLHRRQFFQGECLRL